MKSNTLATDVHPLLETFFAAFEGEFPTVDGEVTVVPALSGGMECSVAFTGHAVVATAALPDSEVRARNPDGFGAAVAPDFLRALAGPAGWIGQVDLMLVAPGHDQTSLPARTDLDEHDRVRRARSLRRNVRVFGDERGFVTLADGLAGRSEISIEIDPGSSDGNGHGRSLLLDARGLVPSGQPLFAAVTPGNARSLRAFLAAGFVPIGSEVLILPERH